MGISTTLNLKDIAFVIFKPDVIKQNLENAILSFFKNHGISIVAQKLGQITKEKRKELYRDFHKNSRTNWEMGAQFYEMGPALFLILYKPMEEQPLSEYISKELKGNFVAVHAKPGTIRGDFNAVNPVFNLIHSSDSNDDTLREMKIFFPDEEIERLFSEQPVIKEINLSYKNNLQEELFSFERLLISVKKNLVEISSLNYFDKYFYRNVLSDCSERISITKNREQMKKKLIALLDFEREFILRDTNDILLNILADHKQFTELDYELLFERLWSSGIKLSNWECCLLKTSMFYIHFL